MDPHDKWCHNARCRAYGLPGEGRRCEHSAQLERRTACERRSRAVALPIVVNRILTLAHAQRLQPSV